MARLIGERGEDMLRRGDAGPVARLVEQVIGEALDDESELLHRTYADALRMSGDPTRARRAFAPLVARADEAGWTAGSGGPGRTAALHVRGVRVGARRARPMHRPPGSRGSRSGRPRTIVDWWACRVHVLAMLGRPEEAQRRRGAVSRRRRAARRRSPARRRAPRRGAGPAAGTLKDLHHDHALRYATAGRRRRDGDPRTRGPHLPSPGRRPLRPGVRLRPRGGPDGPAVLPSRAAGGGPAQPGRGTRPHRRARRGAVAPRVLGRPVPEAGPGPGRPGPGRHGRHPPVARAQGAEPRRLHRGGGARPRVRRRAGARAGAVRVRPCSLPTSRRPRPRTRQPRRFDSPRTTCCRSP